MSLYYMHYKHEQVTVVHISIATSLYYLNRNVHYEEAY